MSTGGSTTTPGEFVPAVEREKYIPISRGFVTLVTDGGLPSSAGIMPANASMLSSFLDDHTDAAGFEITYVDDGTERTQLCHSVSLHAVTSNGPRQRRRYSARRSPLIVISSLFASTQSSCFLWSSPTEPVRRAQRHLPRRQPGSAGSPMRIQAVRISSILALLDREDVDLFGRRTQSRHFVGWRQCAQRTVRRRFHSSGHYWHGMSYPLGPTCWYSPRHW